MKTLTKQWLQKLLPKWDYFCPKCHSQIEKNANECPHCGEKFPFNFAVKAPSKLLKEKKKLSAYVHKKIFPSLSQIHRNYLAKYFTVLFSDGFESGDMSAWSKASGSATMTVQDTTKHHGTYATSASGTSYYKYAKLFTAESTVFMRFYVYFTSLPASGNKVSLAEIMVDGVDDLIVFGVKNDSGTMKWGCTYPDDTYAATPNPTTGQWYCVEFKFDSGVERRIYIDGVSVWNSTADTIDADRVNIGRWDNAADDITVYFDCVVVADSYIGPHVLFENGFEEGDFSAWTTTVNNPEVQDSVTHSGSYAMLCDATYDYAAKTFTSGTTAYGRFYFRLSGLPASDEYVYLCAFRRTSDSAWASMVWLDNTGGNLSIRTADAAWSVYDSEQVTLSANTWYCLEFFTYSDASSGSLKAWLDGVQKLEANGDTSSAGTLFRFDVGDCYSNFASHPDIYFDDVVIADAYIGPEPSSALQTVTDTLTLTENVAHDKGINAGIVPQVPGLSVGAQDKFFDQVYASDGSFNMLKTVSGNGEISICNSAVPATASLYLGTPEHPWVEGTILDVFTKKIQIRESGDINHTFVSPEDFADGEGGIVEIETIMVQDPAAEEPEHNYRALLTIDKPLSSIEVNGYCDFKDTGLALNVHLDPATGGWVEEELAIPPDFKPTYNVAKLWCTTVNPTDRTTSIGDPVLQTSFAFRVEKDLQTFGFVGTSSDPQKQRGGGAIMMGQGFLKDGCPPIFDLTGTLLIKSVAEALLTYPNGTHESRPDDTGSRAKYYQTDDYYQPVYPYQLLEPTGLYEDTPLYNDNNQIIGHEWQFRGTAEAIGSYPTYNTGKYWYDSATKCLKYGNTVAAPYVESGKYDTLFLISGETLTYSPFVLANLYCGRVTAVNGVFVKDGLETDGLVISNGDGLVISNDTDSCAVGINLLGEAPYQYYAIESNGLPWQFDQAVHFGNGVSVDGTFGATQSITTYTQFISTLATGTKPIDVTSTTMCNNLNADMLDGHHWSEVSAGQWTAGTVSAVDAPIYISSGHLQLNVTSTDLVCNSVKGTYSGAAVKAGDYITLSWDGTNSNITAHSRHLQLNTDENKKVIVYRDLHVEGNITCDGSYPGGGNPFDQSLNTTNDAVFNSVKGTYSGAAVKAGDYITLSWDASNSNITAHNRHLLLNTDEGKNVVVYRNFHVNGNITCNGSYPTGNPFNQSLNTTNDAVFNSVKGTYSGAAVKAGDYITLSWGGAYSNITAHNTNLMLNTDSDKFVKTAYSLQVGTSLAVGSYLTVGGHITPTTTNAYDCGNSTYYWANVYAYTFHGDSYAIEEYDSLDDLALLKASKNVKVTKNGKEIKVLDLNSLPFLKSDESEKFYDQGKMSGYMLGCAKALAKNQDKQDEILLKLLNMTEQQAQEITDLRLQIEALKKTNGGENA